MSLYTLYIAQSEWFGGGAFMINPFLKDSTKKERQIEKKYVLTSKSRMDKKGKHKKCGWRLS